MLSEVSKNVEGQSGPDPLDRCAECGHPMRRATDRVDYKFFTLDAEKQTILGHFGGVIPKRRKFRCPNFHITRDTTSRGGPRLLLSEHRAPPRFEPTTSLRALF